MDFCTPLYEMILDKGGEGQGGVGVGGGAGVRELWGILELRFLRSRNCHKIMHGVESVSYLQI